MRRSLYLLAALAAILSLGVCTYLVPGGAALTARAWVRLAWLSAAALLAGWCLHQWAARAGRVVSVSTRPDDRFGWPFLAGVAFALAACVHVGLSYLPAISTYPLTLGWSETSRYYYASLFFARQVYAVEVAPTVLHPSRYLLQAAPFLIPGAPLWLHRAWQVFLWLFLPALCAGLLARRLRFPGWIERIGLSAALFLLFMSGPVYYHLLPPVALIVAGFYPPAQGSPPRAWLKPLAIVLLASAWTGISRINWFPVPAMLAAALYLLERPLAPCRTARVEGRVLLRYLAPVAGLGVLGMAAALAAQALYILWSGNAAEQFATSFTSDLIWSRLLPNPTFRVGILPAALLVTLPAGLIVLGRLLEVRSGLPGWQRFYAWRLAALAALLAVLFAGGLVVSVKIGGGNNLHNMDAALVMVGVIGAYFVRGEAGQRAAWSDRNLQADPGLLAADAPRRSTPVPVPAAGHAWAAQGNVLRLGALLALLIPAAFAVLARGPSAAPPDQALAAQAVQTIAEAAQATAERGGQVLFISNRHLLTFGQIKQVPLAPEYERVFLMELAMAGDPEALGRFYSELKAHRFQLIVSEPLSRQQKGSEEMFGAENDVWVQRVVRYILCYYEPVKTMRPVQVQLLAPRQQPNPRCP